MDTRRLTALMLCMLIVVCAFCHERRLFNLTAADLRVDGRLPQFVYSRELPQLMTAYIRLKSCIRSL